MATGTVKKFHSKQILSITQITQNAQTFTLSEAAENFDAFEIRLLVNGTTGTGCNTVISRQALTDNAVLLFYYGTDTYWATNSFALTGGTGAKTGTIQKHTNISSLYITVYGIKFA